MFAVSGFVLLVLVESYHKKNVENCPINLNYITTYHSILCIRISLSTKFQNKLTISIFRNKFVQNEYFYFETEKVKIAIEFLLLKLA